jgi:predicted TIM-barrel fold metal-dependent hydrolase
MDLSMSKNWIDTHFHVFNAGLAVEGARYVPQYSAQLTDWMKQAQNVGVTRGVWVQPSFLGTDKPVYVKLSGAYRLGGIDPRRLATLLLKEMGPSALLWGSDWPCTNHEQFADFERLIAQAHEWIDAQALEQVMVLNPTQLYGFDGLISQKLRDTGR